MGRNGPRARSCSADPFSSQLPTGGSPLQSRNLAARAARWSAQHRKKAIFGWLAFVIVAFVVGGAVGTKQLGDTDTGNGSSQVADKRDRQRRLPRPGRRAGPRPGPRLGQDRRRRVHRRGQRHRRAPEGRPARQGRRVPAGRRQQGPALQGRPLRARHVQDRRRRRPRQGSGRRRRGRRRRRAEGPPAAARRAVRRRQRRQGAVEVLRRTTSRRPSTSRCRSRWRS